VLDKLGPSEAKLNMLNTERLQSYSRDRFLAFEKQIVDAITRERDDRRRALEELRARKRKSKKKKKKR
jgi:hypothetical protein